MSILREDLPSNVNEAIEKLKEIIKAMPPKECYFIDENDFVAPFTITCEEEMLMQLLITEKELTENKKQKYCTTEEVFKSITNSINNPKPSELQKKYEKQAEEGYIRRFFNKKS